VARLLNKEIRRTGNSLKQVVNDSLRTVLTAPKKPTQKPFVVKPWNLRPPPGMNFDNVEEVIEFLEGPHHR